MSEGQDDLLGRWLCRAAPVPPTLPGLRVSRCTVVAQSRNRSRNSAVVSADVNTSDVTSLVCATLAAGGNALSNVMQRRASLEQPPEQRFGLRLLAGLVRRRTWLLGFGGMVSSFVLQAVALDLGQLSAVETVITLEVPLTLVVAARVFRAPMGAAGWIGIWTMTAGAIAVIASLDPRPGQVAGVSHAVYAIAGGGTAMFVVVLLLAAQHGRAMWRTACLGAAAGTAFGLTAALIKATVAELSAHGVTGMLSSWQTYAAAVTGLSGVLIMQWALHTGPLLASQPGFTLMDPLVSILWGSLVYGEVMRTGLWLAPAAAGALAIGVGVPLLARSPLVTGYDDPRLGEARSLPVEDLAS